MVKMRKWASGRQNLHIMNDDYICTFLIDADISICGLLKILKYQTVIFIHPYVLLCYLLSFQTHPLPLQPFQDTISWSHFLVMA
jgi:hypothetical protein